MWPEFSTVNDANLVKKIFYDSGNIEFFPGYRFSLAPPVILGTYYKILQHMKHVDITSRFILRQV